MALPPDSKAPASDSTSTASSTSSSYSSIASSDSTTAAASAAAASASSSSSASSSLSTSDSNINFYIEPEPRGKPKERVVMTTPPTESTASASASSSSPFAVPDLFVPSLPTAASAFTSSQQSGAGYGLDEWRSTSLPPLTALKYAWDDTYDSILDFCKQLPISAGGGWTPPATAAATQALVEVARDGVTRARTAYQRFHSLLVTYLSLCNLMRAHVLTVCCVVLSRMQETVSISSIRHDAVSVLYTIFDDELPCDIGTSGLSHWLEPYNSCGPALGTATTTQFVALYSQLTAMLEPTTSSAGHTRSAGRLRRLILQLWHLALQPDDRWRLLAQTKVLDALCAVAARAVRLARAQPQPSASAAASATTSAAAAVDEKSTAPKPAAACSSAAAAAPAPADSKADVKSSSTSASSASSTPSSSSVAASSVPAVPPLSRSVSSGSGAVWVWCDEHERHNTARAQEKARQTQLSGLDTSAKAANDTKTPTSSASSPPPTTTTASSSEVVRSRASVDVSSVPALSASSNQSKAGLMRDGKTDSFWESNSSEGQIGNTRQSNHWIQFEFKEPAAVREVLIYIDSRLDPLYVDANYSARCCHRLQHLLTVVCIRQLLPVAAVFFFLCSHIPLTIALSRAMTPAELKSGAVERVCTVSVERDQIGYVSLKPADEVLLRGKLFRVYLEGNHEAKKHDVRVRAFRYVAYSPPHSTSVRFCRRSV
jgi:hypothetical protein